MVRPRPQPSRRPQPHAHPAGLSEEALLQECTLRRTRASGPGGQHRNKVSTAVVLTHSPTGVSARATESRQGETNRRMALRRLRLALAVAERRKFVAPSPLWRSRVRAGRVAVNPGHADVPPLLAEALDALLAHAWQGVEAALVLEITQTQLVRLLALQPTALAVWNGERERLGLSPLHGRS